MPKTILITGSSSGLGRETAKYFRSIGWKAAATMRSPEKEPELADDENFRILKMDVTDTHSVRIDPVWNTNVQGVINVIRAGMKHYREHRAGIKVLRRFHSLFP